MVQESLHQPKEGVRGISNPYLMFPPDHVVDTSLVEG